MDPLSILGNIVASIIVGAAVFLYGRSRGWWLTAKAKRKTLPSDGKKFTLLVAELERDANRKQTDRVIDELEKQFPQRGDVTVHILPYHEVLSIGPGERARGLQAAEKQGRRWLCEKNGDVLIWGKVEEDKILRLRFLPNLGLGSEQKTYTLNEVLELPVDFGSDLGAVLAAQAASAISSAYERSGEALATLIAPIVAKLIPLAENPPASFPEKILAQLWNAYAAGEQRLGEERGDNTRLATAITYYKKALTIWTRERVPQQWAGMQTKLGTALQALGERKAGRSSLRKRLRPIAMH